MARWQLMSSHYLRVEDNEWEYRETAPGGKMVKKVYNVPRLLDKSDHSCYTDPQQGIIVVCHKGKGQPNDIVFFGPPTPDMMPLDDEAKKITELESKKWTDPIDSFMTKEAVPFVPAQEAFRRI